MWGGQVRIAMKAKDCRTSVKTETSLCGLVWRDVHIVMELKLPSHAYLVIYHISNPIWALKHSLGKQGSHLQNGLTICFDFKMGAEKKLHEYLFIKPDTALD